MSKIVMLVPATVKRWLCGLCAMLGCMSNVPVAPAPQTPVKGGPTIAVIVVKGTDDLGVNADALIAAMQEYIDAHVAPVWATPCNLVRSGDFISGAWALVFSNDADVAGALGYHDLTPEGMPLSHVFVRTTINDGEKVSVTASHELVEMLVDPMINLLAGTVFTNNQYLYAYESADPVEAYSFDINGIPMSDFIYPQWFEDCWARDSKQFDHMKMVRQPFQIVKGGYMPVFVGGNWSQIFAAGDADKLRKFQREDRRYHRTEKRERGAKKLVYSAIVRRG